MPHILSLKKPYLYILISVFLFVMIFAINSVFSQDTFCNPVTSPDRCNPSVPNWVQSCGECDSDSDSEWCNTINCKDIGKVCDNGACEEKFYICADDDNDGYGVCPNCGIANGCYYGGDDCDDSKQAVNPDANEDCTNGIDDDCDGDIDLADSYCVQENKYCDNDDDGYFSKQSSGTCNSIGCALILGCINFVGNDCNDNNSNVYPNNMEICDGVDNNCDGNVDEGCNKDNDADCDCNMPFTPGSNLSSICQGTNTTNQASWDSTCDCDDNKWFICKQEPTDPGYCVETCDTYDNDCDGIKDDGCDDDNDGYCDDQKTIYNNSSMCPNTIFSAQGMTGDDCDDNDPQAYPGGPTDCVPAQPTCVDNDGDGYGVW